MGLPPGAVYTVIGVLAAVENIVPFVPADTAVALGAFLSTAGAVSAWAVFLVTWVANVTTATLVYLAGRRIGRPFFSGRTGQRLLRPHHLARLESLYSRYGAWGILLSRLIPGVRAVVPPFAGVARVGFWRAVPPMALASGGWYGALTYLAATLVTELNDIPVLVSRVNRVALVVALVVAVAALVMWRRRVTRLRSSALVRARPGGEGNGGGD